MQAIYPYAKIVHIFCAIIFVGYLFFDVVIFSRLKNVLKDDFERVKMAITSRAIKIMPVCLLLLFLSGGMMISTWVGSKNGGYFSTPLQTLLMIKVLLALIILTGVIYSLSCRFLGKKPANFVKENLHVIALIFGFFIVLFAKLMFIV
ncbi:copper resistance protein CopD [Campylobacter gastrosuis]|uniref:Copper resistance protein CopD n=1 Tax=Campylobacter gastrosuis TaxID=2974576 RepID=A0ABT7HS61_9BACT|nr:copper resistance protein CopD [Campylobacter gastrosuis]MDL0089746.1 copper resistance protein CopD [Campylobacter gastrosuis]